MSIGFAAKIRLTSGCWSEGSRFWTKAETLSHGRCPTHISRRKEVESALQRSEEAYRSVVNAVTQVLFRSDHDGRLTFLNPAWQGFTGLAVETCLSRALTDFVVAEDRERAREIMSLAGKSDSDTATVSSD